MKRKFLNGMISAVLLTAILFSVLMTFLLVNVWEEQVAKDLSRNLTEIGLALNREERPTEYLDSLCQSDFPQRITWISARGEVLYDNTADLDALANHLNREEIQQALQHGTGHSYRYSDTHRDRTYYYAMRLADGSFLRLSDTRSSVYGALFRLSGWLLLALAAAVLLTTLFSVRLVQRIVEPLNHLPLQQPDQQAIYPELRPLMERLNRQNRSIQEYIHELNAHQLQLKAFTDNMSEGLVMLDCQGGIVFLNRSATCLFGAADSLLHHSALELIDADEYRQVMSASLRGHSAEALLERGGRFYQLLTNPVYDDGHFTGAVLLMLDVTDRYLAEQNRRDFTANVSHELKTPLTAIIGYADLMKTGLVAPQDTGVLAERIYHEGTRLLSLVQDIIHLSQLDSGVGLGAPETVDLGALCQEIIARFRQIADSRQVTLTYEGEPVTTQGVRRLLDEVISNLIDNAVKYNHPGGEAVLTLRNDGKQASICVRDTGIGIPEAAQPHVFERFYRVDKSRSKETGGTGLGLSIVKHAVQLHGGSVRLTSQEGKGTAITILLPIVLTKNPPDLQ